MHRFHARSAYVALSRKRTGVQLKAYQVAVVDSVGFSAVAARVSDIVTWCAGDVTWWRHQQTLHPHHSPQMRRIETSPAFSTWVRKLQHTVEYLSPSTAEKIYVFFPSASLWQRNRVGKVPYESAPNFHSRHTLDQAQIDLILSILSQDMGSLGRENFGPPYAYARNVWLRSTKFDTIIHLE